MRQKRLFLIGMLVLATYAGIAQETPTEEQEVLPSTTVEQRSDTSDSEISPTDSSDASPDTTQRQYFYNILFLLVSVVLCFFSHQLRRSVGLIIIISLIAVPLFVVFIYAPLTLPLPSNYFGILVLASLILLPILYYIDLYRRTKQEPLSPERFADIVFVLAGMFTGIKVLSTYFLSPDLAVFLLIIPGLLLIIFTKYYPKLITILLTTLTGGWYIVFNTDKLMETIVPGAANTTIIFLCWTVFCFSGIVVQYKHSRTPISKASVTLRQLIFSREALKEALHQLYPRVILILLLLFGTCLLLYFGRSHFYYGEPVIDCSSKELHATRIVATLDRPVAEGVNTIWCATFLAGWKTLEEELAQEPLILTEESDLSASLNESPDPRPYIPPESLFTAAGWKHKGIMDVIRKGLAKKFPQKKPPVYDDAVDDSLIVYTYLEVMLPFNKSYLQNDEPLVFIDSKGQEAPIKSFGIRKKDDHRHSTLRKQPKILFKVYNENHRIEEFAVDLDRTSKPNQIVLARINPKGTFQEMLNYVNGNIGKRITEHDTSPLYSDELNLPDVMLVPDISFYIKHRFDELSGHTFENDALKEAVLDIVEQDFDFRLHRSGVTLRSEFNMRTRSGSSYYIFDRPFLIYMKQRGVEMPYFAMWVDNAELLCKWGE